MTRQGRSHRISKRTAVFGIGGLFALLLSCGLGATMGGGDKSAKAPTATTTVTHVSTETVTQTPTPTHTKAARPKATKRTAEDVETETTGPRTPVHLIPSATEETVPTADGSGYFANCSEARAAGAAPIYRGQPGYRSELDRDDDGVACET